MGAFASSRPSTPLRHWVTRCLKGGRPSLKQRAPSSNPRPSQNSRFSAQVAPALSFLGHTHLGVGTLTYPMTIAPQCAVSVSQNVVSRVCWFWKPPAGTHVKCSPKDQSHHSRVPFSSPLEWSRWPGRAHRTAKIGILIYRSVSFWPVICLLLYRDRSFVGPLRGTRFVLSTR